MHTKTFLSALAAAALLLAGCEQLGIEDPAKAAAAREAEGKAVGAGCRQSGRAIEDCYEANPRASKAAVFAGWREMNDYMRENKMEAAVPAGDRPVAEADMEEAPAGKAGPREAAKPGSGSKAARRAG